MRYVGLDVHKRSTSICVLGDRGARVQQATVHGEWPKLLEWMRQLDGAFSVCYEASWNAGGDSRNAWLLGSRARAESSQVRACRRPCLS